MSAFTGLTVFGRAQATAAYGVSRILNHVEHLGLLGEVREVPGIPSALMAGPLWVPLAVDTVVRICPHS